MCVCSVCVLAVTSLAVSPFYVEGNVAISGMSAAQFGQSSVQALFLQALVEHMAYYVLLPVSAVSVIQVLPVSEPRAGYCAGLSEVRVTL